MLLQEGRWLRTGIALGLLLSLQGCGGAVDATTATTDCGGSLVTEDRLGPQALDVAVPRHVFVVLDDGLSAAEEKQWRAAAAIWRLEIGDACPLDFSFGRGSVPSVADPTSAPLDTIQVRSDASGDPVHGGEAFHWLECRSGRASVASSGVGFPVRVYRHELGHALGLDHDETGLPSVMSNDPALASRDVTPEDVRAYVAVWCPSRL